MGKPKNKDELIALANTQYEKLWLIINSMSEGEQSGDFCFDFTKCTNEAHWKRDKNLRDVLVHLCEWHRLLLKWEDSNMAGIDKPFLPSPYTWKTYGDMNVEFWRKHQNTSLEEAKEMVVLSHQQVISIIKRHNDEQLFTKGFYKWTGTTNLGQYCISATVSHYEWAIKKLKMQFKALGKKL